MVIKILHLISSPYGLGGAEKLILDMDEFYDREVFSVHYCNLFNSLQKNSLFSRALADGGHSNFEIEGHRWTNIPQIISRLLKLIEQEKFDIVHTHLAHATIVGGIIGKLGKRHRTVVTQHFTRKAQDKFHLQKVHQLAVRSADAVIAISSAVRNDLLEQGVDQSKIRIIPNGVNLDEFDKEASKENHLLDELKEKGKYILGSVGNLHARKDHANLIRAMAKAIKKVSNLHLVIIGEGPERRFLADLIEEYGLDENVSLLGFRPDIPSLLRPLDLYVHSARSEPFGIAILEAMAAKKCVIATKVEGVVDIIENEADGFLISPQDPQMMADYICRAIENRKESSEIGLKGRRKVEKLFRIEKVVERQEILYSEIMQPTFKKHRQ